MDDIDFSDKLVLDYMSLKNGDRDLSKLTSEEISNCHVLEGELLTTAVLLFYQEINNGNLDEVYVLSSPLKIIQSLDGHQLSHVCETFVQSKVASTNEIIAKMTD
jgi:hypothetical protein